MTDTVSIEIGGLEAVRRKLGSPLVRDALRAAMVKSVLVVEGAVKERTPVDTGTLRRSVRSRVQPLEATIGSRLSYAPPVEFGRRPGRMPPVAAVERWARTRGIPPFVLARAIGRRGTKGAHMFRDAARSMEERVRAIFRVAVHDIEREWRKR